MKFVLAMLFPMAMMGTTISATVDCGSGPIGGSGVSSASCNVPGPSTASASADFVSVSNFGIDVAVSAPAGTVTFPSASAVIDVDLLVNVTGSTGGGFFVPCLQGSGDTTSAAAIASVTARISGAGEVDSENDHDPILTCFPPNAFIGQVFAFGQPFTIDLTLSGGASINNSVGGSVGGNLMLTGYEVFESDSSNQTPIPGAIISVTILPEPSAALMMILAIALSLVMTRLRARYLFR